MWHLDGCQCGAWALLPITGPGMDFKYRALVSNLGNGVARHFSKDASEDWDFWLKVRSGKIAKRNYSVEDILKQMPELIR